MLTFGRSLHNQKYDVFMSAHDLQFRRHYIDMNIYTLTLKLTHKGYVYSHVMIIDTSILVCMLKCDTVGTAFEVR